MDKILFAVQKNTVIFVDFANGFGIGSLDYVVP